MSDWDNGITLQSVLASVRAGTNRGLRLGAEHVLGESDAQAPLEEGTLERSGKVSTDDGDLKAAVSYDTPYAVAQHEDLTFRHDAGRNAKYLENALNAEAPTVARIVQQQVRRELNR